MITPQACFAVPTLAAFRDGAPSAAAYAAAAVIAIDEAQFFGDLLEFAIAAADRDAKRVVIAGLDGDFQRRKFGQVLDLIPHADSITKLTAECALCREAAERGGGAADAVPPAVFSLRLAAEKGQEVVGGADKYAPVCRQHYGELTGGGPAAT